jgi:hypothetical protein
VDAERNAGTDDRAQREHADCADRAGDGHVSRAVRVAPVAGWPCARAWAVGPL